jgi:hypothetical protein
MMKKTKEQINRLAQKLEKTAKKCLEKNYTIEAWQWQKWDGEILIIDYDHFGIAFLAPNHKKSIVFKLKVSEFFDIAWAALHNERPNNPPNQSVHDTLQRVIQSPSGCMKIAYCWIGAWRYRYGKKIPANQEESHPKET